MRSVAKMRQKLSKTPARSISKRLVFVPLLFLPFALWTSMALAKPTNPTAVAPQLVTQTRHNQETELPTTNADPFVVFNNVEKTNFDFNHLNEYDFLAKNYSSQPILTQTGFVGLGKAHKSIVLTTYEGVVLWSIDVTLNSFIKTFYEQHEKLKGQNIQPNDLEILNWVHIPAANNRSDRVGLVIGPKITNSNEPQAPSQIFVLVDLSNGAFVAPNTNGFTFDLRTNFLVLEQNYDYAKPLNNNQILLWNNDNLANSLVITTNQTNPINISSKVDLSALANFKAQLATPATTEANTTYFLADLWTVNNNLGVAYLVKKEAEQAGENNNNTYQTQLVSFTIAQNQSNLSINPKHSLALNQITLTNANEANDLGAKIKKHQFFSGGYLLQNNEASFYFLQNSQTSNILHFFKVNTTNQMVSEETNKKVALTNLEVHALVYDPFLKRIYVGNGIKQQTSNGGLIRLTGNNAFNYESITNTSQNSDTTLNTFIPNLAVSRANQANQNATVVRYDGTTVTILKTISNRLLPTDSFTGISIVRNFWTEIKDEPFIKMRLANQLNTANVQTFVRNDNKGGYNVRIDYVFRFQGIRNDTALGYNQFVLHVSYRSRFTQIHVNLNFPVVLTGFFQFPNPTNYTFNFVTEASIDKTKFATINKLKSERYAKDITKQEVLDYFISYQLKDRNSQPFTIQQQHVNLAFNHNLDQLTVTINLPANQFAIGIPSDKLNLTHKFTGFLSTEGFELGVDNAQLSLAQANFYPSNITPEMIVNNWITKGAKIFGDVSNFQVVISEVNDFLGTFKIDLVYNNFTNVAKPDLFPKERFHVWNQQTLAGFKNLNNTLTTPTLISNQFDSFFLPSQIYQQYLRFNQGLEPTSILFNQVVWNDLVNPTDLLLTATNANRADVDGFLDLAVTVKPNALTNVAYTGLNSVNGLLAFNQPTIDLLAANGFAFPFALRLEIITRNIFFQLKNGHGGFFPFADDTYLIDLNVDAFDPSLIALDKTMFASEFDVNQLQQLFNFQGYDVKLGDKVINETLGTLEVNVILQPLNQLVPSDNPSLDNELNNIRKIKIINFQIGPTAIIELLMQLSYTVLPTLAGIGLVGWLLFWYRKQIYKHLLLQRRKWLIKQHYATFTKKKKWVQKLTKNAIQQSKKPTKPTKTKKPK